jgi:phosphoribosylformimino-5-aminoimidazole carboxamide ribotide isomerase
VRIIGVLDLLRGRAVHARAGDRGRYEPVRVAAGSAVGMGDAVALARAYVERLGVDELYVADLDALTGGRVQDALIADVAALGAPFLLDAAVTSVADARHALFLCAARVIVALETLQAYDVMRDICTAVGGDRVVFSLDLRDGVPIVARASGIAAEPPHVVAMRARDAGAQSIIVIDLARVGTGRGIDLGLIARVRAATAGLTLLAGGGVRGADDLARLADVGCDGALVASALHDGRIGAADVAAARRHGSFSR